MNMFLLPRNALPRRFAMLALGLAIGGGLAVGCRRVDQNVSTALHNPLRIVCTTGMVADMLRNLAGQHAQVQSLMGPGVDPHLYKATPGDVRRLAAADAVFYSGLHLEGRLAELLEKLHRWKPAYAVTDGLRRDNADRLRYMPGSEGVFDPHVWFDVALWARCAEYATEKLVALDPSHAADYRRNGQQYVARLAALDAECRRQMAEIPRARRVLVTAHDAFGYFGRAYDVDVRGLQGISTLSEADLGAVNELIEMLVERGIKAVFVESSVPAKNIQALIEGCAARGHPVRVGGELFSDALGPPGTPEDNYVGMVAYNVRTIAEALK
jgi:manganese/zinc/iron transport system substrate-binding protein